MDAIFANLVMIFHFTYVCYIILGFVYIWLGFFLQWKSIYNPLLRWTHLAAMGIVILETAFGFFCPLTEWEAKLRRGAGQSFLYPQGFIPHWVHKFLYYNWPDWMFAVIYIAFFVGMCLTFIFIPPKKPDR